MALISEVTEGIYEIKPEGEEHKSFPLCTVYLVVDDKTALVEVGFWKSVFMVSSRRFKMEFQVLAVR